MPVSGSAPTSSSPPARSSGQDRSTHNNPRDEQRQRDDFQRKLLNRESGQKSGAEEKTQGKQSGVDPRGRKPEESSHQLAGASAKDEKRDTDKLAALAQHQGQHNAIAGNNPLAGQASAAADIDPAMQSQLDRIAAAIAEMSGKDGQAKYTLQLPGSSPIESAVLARNAAGFISILLVARPGTLDRQQRRQIRAELDERLKTRAVKMGDIGFAGDTGRNS